MAEKGGRVSNRKDAVMDRYEKDAQSLISEYQEHCVQLYGRTAPADVLLEKRITSALRDCAAAAREEALEGAAKLCESEARRYMEHPACPAHALGSDGCAKRIRALAEQPRREES
jgi:hypothetical protein